MYALILRFSAFVVSLISIKESSDNTMYVLSYIHKVT
jgi:hypothetical protein